MSITAEQSATEQIVVKAREPAPPRRFLQEPTDIVAIATLAQEHTRQATIRTCTPRSAGNCAYSPAAGGTHQRHNR